MAARYWVGGSGTWDSTTTTNWSISSGGAGGASAPTTSDNAVFDANSGTSATVTVTATATSSYTSVNKSDLTLSLSGSPTLTTQSYLTLTSGTITLNNNTLTIYSLFSPDGAARTINFGTGNITCIGNNSTMVDAGSGASLTITGTPTFNATYSGSVGTRTFFSPIGFKYSLNVSAGSDIINISPSGTNYKNDVNLTGFTGSLATTTNPLTLYGNLTLGSGMTASGYTGTVTFAAASGTQTITSNGVTVNFPIVASGSGTFTISGALTSSSTYTSSGTKSSDFGYTTATFSSVTLGATSATVGFGSVGLVLTGSGTCFSETVSRTSSSYYTTSVISATSSSPKTMSFYPTNSYVGLNQGGTGALTLTTSTGAGDINLSGTTLKNSVQPATISITGGLTIRGIGTLQLNGTAGNLVTLGSTNTTPVTLESYDVGVQTGIYCSVSYITGSNAAALGGTGVLWRFLNSTNGGNNTNLTFGNTYYWIGGSGTWDATANTNWSLTSGGSGGAGVPTQNDDVVFDSSSNTATYTVSGLFGYCFNLTANGPASGTVTLSTTSFVYGNITLPATGVTSFSNPVLNGVSGTTQTLITNDVGIIQLQTGESNVLLSGSLTASTILLSGSGTFDTAGYSVTTSQRIDTQTFTPTLNLGASTITVSGYNSTSTYTFRISTGSTVNAGTSTINVTGANTGTYLLQFGGKTFYNVTLNNGNYNGVTYNITDTVTNTFNTFTYNGSSAAPSLNTLTLSGNITTTTLNLNTTGTYNNRLFVKSDTIGTQRSISMSTGLNGGNCDFRDINFTGALVGVGGYNNGDCGGNTGLTVATKTVYWNLAGTQNWSTTGWATSSGGTPAAANFPLAQDTVYFDNTGSAGTVTIDKNWNIGTIDMSNRSSAMTLATGTTTPTVYGDRWYYGTGITTTGTGTITFSRRDASTAIYGQGVTMTQAIIIDSIGGGLGIVYGTLITTNTITLTRGTLDLNGDLVGGRSLTCQSFSSSGTITRTLAFGTTGQINVTGSNSLIWDTSQYYNLTVTGTPTVNFTYSGSFGTRDIRGPNDSNGSGTTPLVNVNITAGSDSILLDNGTFGNYLNVNFTGYTGYANLFYLVNGINVYGNFTLGSGMTTYNSFGEKSLTFLGTSGTQTLTTNGVTVNFPVVQNNPGATVQLGSSFTSGNTYTLTAGTLSANNYNVTIPSLSSSGSTTRSIIMGSETWTISGSGTVWNCSTPTNLSVTPGTSKISMTSASTKTFAGGNKTWGILNQGGAGALTITGTNTFADIQASSLPSTIIFPASVTTTVSAFTAKGTAGNLLTLQSSSAGTQFNISKSSGVVVADYLSLKDSSATGGAQWRAGLNSTIVSNVSGWLLLGPPTQIRASINSSGVLYVPNFNQLDEVSKSINSVGSNALYSNLFDETQTLTFTPPNQSVPGSLALANTKPTSTTSNNYIETANSTSFAINSTQDFTIEAWVKFNSYPVGSETQTIFQIWPRSGSGTYFNYTGWALNLYGPNYTNPPQIYFINFGGGGSSTGFSPTLNTWHHLAYTRQNGNLYYFINGSFQNPTIVDTNAITSAIIKVGKDLNFDGNITNLRLTIGNALYTSSFTPSTVPLTKQANTALLLTMNSNNPFGDSSNNIISVSAPNANVAFSTNSPFTFIPATVPVAQRKTADGKLLVSGYFDETTLQ